MAGFDETMVQKGGGIFRVSVQATQTESNFSNYNNFSVSIHDGYWYVTKSKLL